MPDGGLRPPRATNVVTDAGRVVKGMQGYYPFGETRYTTGTLYTDKLYTGYRSLTAPKCLMAARSRLRRQQNIAGIGLYNYKARFYDPLLGRFISADTVTPGGPQGLNRYSYVNNNPINFGDPTGHQQTCRPVEDEDRPECYRDTDSGYRPTPKVYADNYRYQAECASGHNQACPGGTTGMIVTGALMVATAGAAEYIITGGIAADAAVNAAWNAAEVCATSTACWTAIGAGGAAGNSIDNRLGSTGDIGEEYLQQNGGTPQQYFQTTQGGRYVDQLVNGMAYESKVGYVSLTEDISLQVSKDVKLLATGQVNSVSWVFFPSPLTGVGGPSLPLYNLLTQNGISVFYIFP